MTARPPAVAVVGNGVAPPDHPAAAAARELGRLLVDNGYRVVTGGLTGVMEAACRGARESASYKPGATVGIVPGHDPSSANPYVDVALASGLSVARNTLVAHSEAVIAIGGGAGTLSEMAVAWVLDRLIVGICCGGWSEKLAGTRIDDRVRYPGIPEDQVYRAATAADAVELLRLYLPRYTSRPTPSG